MKKPLHSLLLSLLTPLLTLFLGTGCSTFNRDWNAAKHEPAAGLAGRWQGTWKSAATGHSGGLRCLLRKEHGERYQARFRATYATVLNFESAVELQAKRRGRTWQFRGHSDLPAWAGGRYTYDGRADAGTFSCNYRSRWDHGVFEMARVPSERR